MVQTPVILHQVVAMEGLKEEEEEAVEEVEAISQEAEEVMVILEQREWMEDRVQVNIHTY